MAAGPDFDTVLVAARPQNFKQFFIKERKWYPIYLSPQSIPRLKHIAVYQVAPTKAITHAADIIEIVELNPRPFRTKHSYAISFSEPHEIPPIPYVAARDGKCRVQSKWFTQLSRLLAAHTLSDVRP